MTLNDLLTQHAQTMNAMTASNVEEVQANSAKLREVIGDPYAAYRLLRTEPKTETKDGKDSADD